MAEAQMTESADLLWHVNNEYRRRLSKARKYLELLDQLLLVRRGSDETLVLETLRYAQAQVGALGEEHRGWRYAFFYETPEQKRMVQNERAVLRALAHFNRMSGRHRQQISEIQYALATIQRPNSDFTLIPGGDLWEMMQFALNDLADFLGSPGAVH
jgi:hypothetical protein